MIKKLLISAWLCSGLVSSWAATYTDVFDEKLHIVISNHTVQLTDVISDVYVCPPSDPFVCIKSRSFNFGVPKDTSLKEWEFAGEHYRVTAIRSEELFGLQTSYKIILVKEKTNLLFAYSEDFGVIAFKDKSGHVLVMSGKCGFARLKMNPNCDSDD
jgi:hypothetical protein